MSQNRSTAVMQRRQSVPASLDYFPTPPWATRALCEFLAGPRDAGGPVYGLGEPLYAQSCWEPACGEMHMARPLAEYFGRVEATDVYRYSDDHGICDFLSEPAPGRTANWIVTNPPFLLGQSFVALALRRARRGVAMLVRQGFTESDERHRGIFAPHPPSFELQFVERVVMLRGRLIRAGAPDPFNLDPVTGDPRKASSATGYCWLVWIHGQSDTRKRWIPKCRERLERAGDYPTYPEQWAAIAPEAGGLL